MATMAVRPPAAPVKKRAKWNTLQFLRGSQYVAWALCVLFLIAAISAATIHRAAMTKVCKDAEPSVIAAEEIKFALSDMDANAANELLYEHGEKSDDEAAAVKQYNERRDDAVDSLIKAAENINFGDAEREPIKQLALNMGVYEARIQTARDLHKDGKPGVAAAYLDAAAIMDNNLLPQADKLHKVNEDELNRIYASHESESVASIFFVVATGLALAAFLIYLQWFLLRKTRRVLNPMLLVATVLALGFVLYTVRVMSKEREQLKVAKEDAYDSIVKLWQSRAVAYAANADESRYLLDGGSPDSEHRGKHEKAFYQKVRLLSTLPSDAEKESNAAIGKWVEDNYNTLASGSDEKNRIAGFSGYLADELDNVTFPGERKAALETLHWFGVYLKIDRQIREKMGNGDYDGARELCLGEEQNQSNWAFENFDEALGRTLLINEKEFDNAVELGYEDLKGFDVRASIAIIVIAVLVFGGLLPRIAEYR